MLCFRRLFLAILLTCTAALADAQAYTSIVVFGDSLSDTGNVSHLTTAAYGASVAFPGPAFNYTLGSFTDGADTGPTAQLYQGVWIKQLAASLPAQPKVIDSLDGGTNYAYANATTANGTNALPYGTNLMYQVTVDNMGKQVSDYLATRPAITPATLFVIWGGTNDVLNGSTNAQYTAAATQELALMQSLIGAGATDFLVANVLPLGATPGFNTGANASAETQAADTFNQALAAGLAALPSANPGVTLHLFPLDTFTLYNTWIAEPAANNLTNVTQSAMGQTGIDPDNWLFWDYLHPTTGAHQLIARAAANLLSPSYTATTLVSSASSATAGSAVTFTATVSSVYGQPSGTVTFYDGGTAIATSQLSAATPATATYTTTNLSVASHSITAAYLGGSGFASSISPAITETVTAPPVTPGVTSSLNPASLTVETGSLASTTFSITAVGGYTGSVALSCGTLPVDMACSFAPASLTLTSAASTQASTVTISTSQPALARNAASSLSLYFTALLPFAGLAWPKLRKTFRSSRGRSLLMVLLVSLCMSLAALSGCSSASQTVQPTALDVSPGTYTIPITMTSGTISSTTNLTLTVTH